MWYSARIEEIKTVLMAAQSAIDSERVWNFLKELGYEVKKEDKYFVVTKDKEKWTLYKDEPFLWKARLNILKNMFKVYLDLNHLGGTYDAAAGENLSEILEKNFFEDVPILEKIVVLPAPEWVYQDEDLAFTDPYETKVMLLSEAIEESVIFVNDLMDAVQNTENKEMVLPVPLWVRWRSVPVISIPILLDEVMGKIEEFKKALNESMM